MFICNLSSLLILLEIGFFFFFPISLHHWLLVLKIVEATLKVLCGFWRSYEQFHRKGKVPNL